MEEGDNYMQYARYKFAYLTTLLVLQLSWIGATATVLYLVADVTCTYNEQLILYGIILGNSFLSIITIFYNYCALNECARQANKIIGRIQRIIMIGLIAVRFIYSFSDCDGQINLLDTFFTCYIIIEEVGSFAIKTILLICIRFGILCFQPYIMVQLAGNFPIRTGATDADIETLIHYKYWQETLLDADDRGVKELTTDDTCCPICIENYQDEEIICLLDCDHHYHAKCLKDWLKINDVCPLCRSKVF